MASTCTEPPYAESLHGSVETDSMNVAPYDELTEDLQSPQSNSTINSNTPLAPVSGPAGTTGLEFPYLAHQGASSSSRGPSADLRKKFKVAIQNVRAARRFQQGSSLYTGGVAAEPGLDYRTMDIEGYDNPSEVTVIDYSATRCSMSKKMRTLDDLEEFFRYDRPRWAKVRWINVDGLNWQYIKLLATKYNLHRLAVEDLLSVQRTKIDMYKDHTYVCLLLHVLIGNDNQIVIEDEDSESISSLVVERAPDRSFLSSVVKNCFKRDNGTGDMVHDAEIAAGMGQSQKIKIPLIAQHYNPDRRFIYDEAKSMRESNLTVAVEQVSIFLTSDGTLITFFQQSGKAIEKPIMERLASENTILRTSEDASLLLQSIIDAVVDLSFPIATAYQELIADLEIDVLTNPQMQHTRELHIVSGELNILKRTLSPMYNMINALRDHCPAPKRAGCFNPSVGRGSDQNIPQGPTQAESEDRVHGVEISSAARVYLADVADHVLILTEEIDMLRGTVENMINLIFNLVASTQNESMRQLTMASLIFLPLTFITGYFGMNFNQQYWRALTNNGPNYFWQIAIPTTIFTMLLLMASYLRRLMKTASRQMARKGIQIKLRKSREMRRHRGTSGIARVDTTAKRNQARLGG